jgi:hypothetical protein
MIEKITEKKLDGAENTLSTSVTACEAASWTAWAKSVTAEVPAETVADKI